MFRAILTGRFILKTAKIDYRLELSVSNNFARFVHYAMSGERFDERILKYIRTNPSFGESVVDVNCRQLNRKVKVSFDNFFDRNNFEKSSKKVVLPASSISKLPYYILEVGHVKDNRHLGLLSLCDFHCSKIFLANQTFEFKEDYRQRYSSLKILDAWMYVLEHYYLVAKLQCYPALIKQSAREITANLISKSSNTDLRLYTSGIIHLAFVASLGKKNLFESHEVMSQLAMYCTENPEVTYKAWNDFETAVMCSSFFRSGIKIQSSEFLHEISSKLHKSLEMYLCSNEADTKFDVSITISLLKVLRQANFVEDRILSSIRKLIMDKDKAEDILKSNLTVLSHLMSAFSSSSTTNKQMTLDPALVGVLNRAEHLVNATLRFGEKIKAGSDDPQSESEKRGILKKNEREVQPSMKSRLKDISRWLWTAASLGYHNISLRTYDADFSNRFSKGEFFEETPAAVEALLALVTINHYPDSIITKVLHSLQFTNALKVKCSNRQKVQFALFLTMVKIERNDLWRKLSPQQKAELEKIAPPHSWNENQGWKSEPYNDPKSEKYPLQYCEMINECMESLNKVFQTQKIESNRNETDLKRKYGPSYRRDNNESVLTTPTVRTWANENGEETVHIYRGCAVPYLFIPGIKIDFLPSGKTFYVEVMDTQSFSVGYLLMKLRVVSQLGHAVLYITPEEMRECPDLGKFFHANISRLLFPQS